MLLLDWVNFLDDIPVNESGTGRRSGWTLVNPAVVSVNYRHKIRKRNDWDSRVGCSGVPLERFKQAINKWQFFLIQVCSVVLDWEQNAQNCLVKVVLANVTGRQMVHLHLKVESNAVDGVFRSGTELELHSVISRGTVPLILNKLGIEGLSGLARLVDVDSWGRSLPPDKDPICGSIAFLVCVNLVVFVSCSINKAILSHVLFQVNGTLVWTSAIVLDSVDDSKVFPISSVLGIVPLLGERSLQCQSKRHNRPNHLVCKIKY